MQKNGKFQGVTVNLTGNPGGSTSKKSISSTGGYNFFLEKPNKHFLFCKCVAFLEYSNSKPAVLIKKKRAHRTCDLLQRKNTMGNCYLDFSGDQRKGASIIVFISLNPIDIMLYTFFSKLVID